MKKLLLSLLVVVCLSSMLYAQKDTVNVEGYYATGGTYGTLNDAIETAIANGTINNTVFKLAPFEIYVLSRSIYMDHGQNLEIVAPKPLNAGDADAETVQNSAPPQIVWTEEGIDRTYLIQSYGDVVMKNIWVRYADVLGSKVGGSITFENQDEANDPEIGEFEGCLFDYCGIGAESAGAFCIKADHYQGTYKNCYWRNNADNHFRYYGRAVSFPYQSTGWHYDMLLFENCTFTNLARIVMQEGNEFGSNIHINHCTLVNSIEWVFQSAGWLETASITNSIFVNPMMIGYRALDVCDDDQDYGDFEDGLCDPPDGGLINGITEADSFGFQVDFTDLDRKLFIGNNAYMYMDWFKAWYTGCTWCQENTRTRHPEENYNPSPMLGENEIAFIDSVDAEGNKVFKKMNVDWATIYDMDPEFIVSPTNEDTLKIFMEYKWSTNADVDWSYKPNAGFNQVWPLPENLAYNNTAYQTAAMGGFPLGDLNWYPDQMAAWKAQSDAEWTIINNWLDYGNPEGTSTVRRISNTRPADYTLGQNYPNPFNPTTNIEYSIATAGHVTLKVFNSLGQEVATLYDNIQDAGKYVATFDGSKLSSGNYIYQLRSGDVTLTRKFALMK
ncbi:T9SS type A sorting domain-containing protein [candidate division KSB1 bacterium]|nr:T9SS type A sorting domain-containing protein [candidate division KSB1 bacterium]